MIEVSVKVVDGVRFIDTIKVVPPYYTRNGVKVELVHYNIIREAQPILGILGYKKCGYDIITDSYIFVPTWYHKFIYKILEFLLLLYHRSIWFLYDNARLFREIPPGECFSWRYFILYHYLVNGTKMLRKIKNLTGALGKKNPIS